MIIIIIIIIIMIIILILILIIIIVKMSIIIKIEKIKTMLTSLILLRPSSSNKVKILDRSFYQRI